MTIFFQQNLYLTKKNLVLFCAFIVVPDDNQKEMEIVGETWIKNNTYHLTLKTLITYHKFSDRDILFGVTGWLNDSLTDAARKFICKSLGRLESW